MGMYTELIFGAELKPETPDNVINTLRWLAGDLTEEPAELAINLTRNPLRGGSYYFGVNSSVTKMWFDSISNAWILSSRANLKNYNSEIETFLEWIKPYVDSGSGARNMFAIVTYEESEEPTIYYLDDPEQLYCDSCGEPQDENADHCQCYDGKEWVKKNE